MAHLAGSVPDLGKMMNMWDRKFETSVLCRGCGSWLQEQSDQRGTVEEKPADSEQS